MAGRVTFVFDSRSDDAAPVTARADRAGRFCVVWPREEASTSLEVEPGPAGGTRDPRVERVLYRHRTNPERPVAVAIVDVPPPGVWPRRVFLSSDWRPSDARADCSEPELDQEWQKVEGAEDNWRVKLVRWTALGALFMIVAAVALVGFRRLAAPTFWLALVGTAFAALAWAWVWIPAAR
jgi:hypothetical protein